MMETNILASIIVEATKFFFNEASKWLDNARKKSGTERPPERTEAAILPRPTLNRSNLASLDLSIQDFQNFIDRQALQMNAYTVKGLVEQIRIHHSNLTDFETAEAELGVLTPPHIKRGIEREASAITEKTERLKSLLEEILKRRIEDE